MNIPRPLAIALWPLSLVYGSAAKLRAWLYKQGWLKQKRLNRPVISVGNITVGGTGKTPMVIWLAEKLLAEGKHVAILSRGYRGANGTSDEIELMKQRLQGRVQFGVGSDRYAEAQRLDAAGVDVYLLDDGFQHLQLARDADIVLVDSTRPAATGICSSRRPPARTTVRVNSRHSDRLHTDKSIAVHLCTRARDFPSSLLILPAPSCWVFVRTMVIVARNPCATPSPARISPFAALAIPTPSSPTCSVGACSWRAVTPSVTIIATRKRK